MPEQEEITRIASKRSDFEHKLNVRGSAPADYARYVEYEITLDKLRRKRAKRLGARGQGHLSQMRILSILNRATTKFPGDFSLWTEYLDYAKKQHAFKTVVEILTKLVRLHPTKPELWIYAATSAFDENGDMTEARSYMQRGLRFCKNSKELWFAYFRLELLYLSKLARRRRILGLDEDRKNDIEDKEPDLDLIALPNNMAGELDFELTQALGPKGSNQDIHESPALQGAIPIAIFDASLNVFNDVEFAEQFFDLCTAIIDVPAMKGITSHIVHQMTSMNGTSPATLDCFVRQPLVGVKINTAEFPQRLRESIKRLQTSAREEPSLHLARRTLSWTSTYLQQDSDHDIRTVLAAIATSALDQYRSMHDTQRSGSEDEFLDIVRKMKAAGLVDAVQSALSWAEKAWPSREPLQALKDDQENDVGKT